MYLKCRSVESSTGVLCFVVFCLILLHGCCFFLQIIGLWQPTWTNSMGAVFPAACVGFMALGHILVILATFQTFSLLLST